MRGSAASRTSRPGPSAGAALRTRQAAWDWGAGRLCQRGLAAAEARLEAEVLLRHAAGVSREELLVRPGAPLPPDAAAAYATLIERRLAGSPTAYLVGHREFFGLDFIVDERVLIPRPETERLVEVARERLSGLPAPLIADIGTGSGAVAIALALALPRARVVATDVSPEALAVARLNAVRHGVADRIAWGEGDALDPLAALGLEGRVDAIVSNPPYIPTAALASLPEEIREHEPRAALDGGPDGLAVLRRVIAEGPRYLRPGGLLALEVAAGGQARVVAALVAAAGTYAGWPPSQRRAPAVAPRREGVRGPWIVRDYAGIERVVVATRGEDDGDHRR